MLEWKHRNPVLFYTAAGQLALLPLFALLCLVDHRTLLGVSVWLKPMKFAASIALLTATLGLLYAHADVPDAVKQRRSQIIAYTLWLEVVLISIQAARGVMSHFHRDHGVNEAIYGVMGLAITVNTIAIGLVLRDFFRGTPAIPPAFLWGIRFGLITLLASSIEGAYMAAQPGHTVGAADGGPGLPFVNWSTQAGDLRAAHFFSMHGLQALPLIGWWSRHSKVGVPLVAAAALLWLALTAGLFLRAVQGQPLIG